MTKAIILDFDGTIADTTESIMMSVRHTAKVLGVQIDEEVAFRTIGLPLQETFFRAFGLKDRDDVENAMAIYRKYFNSIDGVSYIKLYPGVMDGLMQFKSNGISLGIATSRHMESLTFLCDHLGIADLFDVMNTVDTVPNPKPAPDTVLACLDTLGIEPAEAIVTGDTTFDLQMGRRAGCRTCGVTYGSHTPEMLRTESPDYLVSDLRELFHIV